MLTHSRNIKKVATSPSLHASFIHLPCSLSAAITCPAGVSSGSRSSLGSAFSHRLGGQWDAHQLKRPMANMQPWFWPWPPGLLLPSHCLLFETLQCPKCGGLYGLRSKRCLGGCAHLLWNYCPSCVFTRAHLSSTFGESNSQNVED